MKILDMPCTKGFMQLAQDGVDKGWHEMNGGNLSYRLTKDEAANVKKVMKKASGYGRTSAKACRSSRASSSWSRAQRATCAT